MSVTNSNCMNTYSTHRYVIMAMNTYAGLLLMSCRSLVTENERQSAAHAFVNGVIIKLISRS